MGPNFTPLSIPHSPALPPPIRKRSSNRKPFALVAGLILFVGVIAGYLAVSNGLLYKSKASTGFSPVDRRPYENCYQPFQTKPDGADITINNLSNCQNLPPISIDVWKISNSSFDDQTFVWHQEFTVKPGPNHLSIPTNIYSCSDYYQIDTWFGKGTPPENANYGYALITATFVKPAGSSNYGPIPEAYRNGTTLDGPACGNPTATPKPPTATPVPSASPVPSKSPTPTSKATTTPTPNSTTTPVPSLTNACPKPNPVKNLHITCPICQGQ